MPSTLAEIRFAPRWLHGWSVLTAGATVALLSLGAVVTTFQVGMADPVWPTVPWHLALIDWSEPNPGFVIEHAHRLAGYVVGCCVIVLTVGLLLSARRSWLKWLGVAALAGVIVQGLLGGFRVVLHAWLGTNLAVIHGCFAQVVFSLLVSLAVLTSARFVADPPVAEAPRLRLWSLVLTALVFFQLIWGALLRHTNGALAQRMHLMTAFAVVAVAVWFAHLALASPQARHVLGRTLILLGVLLTLQIMLGVESWLGKFAGVLPPEMRKPTIGQAATRVAHVLVGSFILATAVVQTVLLHRSAFQTSPKRERGLPSLTLRAGEGNCGTIVPQLEGTA
ncbi:MAG TPA: COX15/CtaA family protein [Gemmataceae bacterium]|jgi:cytochrome c oxidase assembly protein subunit 15